MKISNKRITMLVLVCLLMAALCLVLKLLGMFTCLCVAQRISFACRETFRAMLVSAIVFLLSALLGLSQLDAVQYISLVPLLNANDILNGWIQEDEMLYGIPFVLVAAGIIFCGGRYLAKFWKEQS